MRKIYTYPFLDKKLQFTFAAFLAALGLGNAAYLSTLFYLFSQESFRMLSSYIPDYAAAETAFSAQTKLFMFTSVLYILLPEVILVVVWGLFFSHRVAGPLYNMRKKLDEIERGGVPAAVTLRKNDLLQDFAGRFNLALSTMHQQRKELETALKDLQEGNPEACEAKLKKLTLPAYCAPALAAPETSEVASSTWVALPSFLRR